MSAAWSKTLLEYELVVEHGGRRVLFNVNLERAYEKIDRKDKAVLTRWMGIWCENQGPLLDTKFKPQQRFAGSQGDSVLIWAFKSYQARVYGFIQSAWGMETFFITEIDPKKKDDKANPRSLKRASDEAFRVLGALRGS